MTTHAAAIGARVRIAREARGWTVEDLRKAAGIAANTVVRIENGRPVRPTSLAKVVAVLGIDASDSAYTEDVEMALDVIGTRLSGLGLAQRAEALLAIGSALRLNDVADALTRDAQAGVTQSTAQEG